MFHAFNTLHVTMEIPELPELESETSSKKSEKCNLGTLHLPCVTSIKSKLSGCWILKIKMLYSQSI